jgi:ATP-binding cassette subfamily B protein
MLKILKYLKKYTGLILLAVCLVLLQAYCDLELPKYMSNMINVGLRQGGIEDWLPDAFSEESKDYLALFLTEDDYKALFGEYNGGQYSGYYVGAKDAYGHGRIDQKEYDAFKKKYTDLDDGTEVYILKNQFDIYKKSISDDELERLRETLKMPVIVYAVFREMFPVSVMDFLGDSSFLAMLWSISYTNGMPEEDKIAAQEAYIEEAKAKDIGWFFEQLVFFSQTPAGDSGKMKYGDDEKKTLMFFITLFLSNDRDIVNIGTRQEIIDALLLGGYKPESVDLIADTILGIFDGHFDGLSKEVTDYIFTLGCIEYKKAEYALAGADVGALQTSYILKNGLMMLLFTVLGILAAIATIAVASKVAAGLARDVRRDIFQKVQSFSNAEFDRFSTASLITRTSNDVSQLHSLLFLLIKNAFYAPIIVVGGLYYVYKFLGIDTRLLAIIGLAALFAAVVIAVLFFVVIPRFRVMQKLIDRINLVARERLGGLLVIKANDNEGYEENRYDDVNKNITRVNLFVNRMLALMQPIMMLSMNILGGIIIWFVVDRNLLLDGTIAPGSLLAFLQYAMQIILAFLLMSGTFVYMPRAMISMKRLWDVLAMKPSVTDAEKTEAMSENHDIRFENVGFKYREDGQEVLKNIDFEVKSGSFTAIVGATGSGKTTLIELLLRFYDPTEGRITVGGHDIRNVAQDELRSIMGYVPQNPTLFSGTVRDNLLAGNDSADEGKMDRSLKVAKADDFIRIETKRGGTKKGDKYSIEISKSGSNLSGGQKQRLSIARAAVREPKVYLFDDSFSALDYMTESSLRRELIRETERGKASVLFISQRIASVLNADNIVVLENGEIIGQGSHKELLKNCEKYAEIARSQDVV